MDGVVRGGDTVAGKEILGEGFASLQLRGGGGGAEDAQALGAEAVDDAGDQGPFRADDGERHAFVAREREQAVDVRSEEHTSELQSLMRNSYAVFCLKKKNKKKKTRNNPDIGKKLKTQQQKY